MKNLFRFSQLDKTLEERFEQNLTHFIIEGEWKSAQRAALYDDKILWIGISYIPNFHLFYNTSHLLVAAISAIHLEWTGLASLWVEGGAEADVVSGCGADKR